MVNRQTFQQKSLRIPRISPYYIYYAIFGTPFFPFKFLVIVHGAKVVLCYAKSRHC